MKISLKLSNPFSGIADSLKSIALSLIQINVTLQKVEIRMATLDTAAQDMTQLTSAADSVVVMLGRMADEIQGLKGSQTDPETARKIDDLDAKIRATTGALANAVVANTPADENAQPVFQLQPGNVGTETTGGGITGATTDPRSTNVLDNDPGGETVNTRDEQPRVATEAGEVVTVGGAGTGVTGSDTSSGTSAGGTAPVGSLPMSTEVTGNDTANQPGNAPTEIDGNGKVTGSGSL